MKSSGLSLRVRTRLARVAAWCLFAVATTSCASGPPTLPQEMDDPLLGLRYDTRHVVFERLPAALAAKAELGDLPYWIYARTGSSSDSTVIVSGFHHIHADDASDTTLGIEPDFGAVLHQHDGKVEVLGVPDGLFGSEPLLPAAQRDALLADAVSRYLKAWGNREALQAALREFKDPTVVPPQLRDALRAQALQVGADTPH